jgi:hypothetical protein
MRKKHTEVITSQRLDDILPSPQHQAIFKKLSDIERKEITNEAHLKDALDKIDFLTGAFASLTKSLESIAANFNKYLESENNLLKSEHKYLEQENNLLKKRAEELKQKIENIT